MKKILLIIYLLLFSVIGLYSQTLRFEQAGTAGDVYFWNKNRGEGGRVMAHLAGDILSINHNNDFTGGVNLGTYAKFRDNNELYQLLIEGSIRTKSIYSFGQIGIGDKENYRDIGQIGLFLNDKPEAYGELVFRFSESKYKSIIYGRMDNIGTLLDFHTAPRNGNGNISRMRITGDGKVGIGTTSPSTLLDVNGDIKGKSLNSLGFVNIGSENALTSFGQLGVHLENTPTAYGEIVFRFAEAQYKSRIMSRIDNIGTNLTFITSPKTESSNGSIERMRITGDGKVGIGTTSPTALFDVNGEIKGKKLDINGTIRAKEVKIEATGWADFVFDKNYKLPTLESVEQHIAEKQHLPDMPSEKEVLEDGVNVVDMQAKLLQKIEELTLYVIQLDKENKVLKQEIKELKEK